MKFPLKTMAIWIVFVAAALAAAFSKINCQIDVANCKVYSMPDSGTTIILSDSRGDKRKGTWDYAVVNVEFVEYKEGTNIVVIRLPVWRAVFFEQERTWSGRVKGGGPVPIWTNLKD